MDFITIINHFQQMNGTMIKNLTDTCIHMIYYMILIDLTLTFLFVEEEGLNVFIKLFKKILLYGFFIYMIKNFANIVDIILHGFIQLGNLSTTGNPSKNIIVSPGQMFKDLLDFILSIISIGGVFVSLDAIPLVSIESVPTSILIFALFMATGALFIGIEITVIYIKFFITTSNAIILMPFGAFKKTQDIAMKGLHALFAQGIEIMFATIILNFYKKYKDSLFGFTQPPTEIHFLGAFQNVAIMFLFCVLVYKIPNFVSTMLSGSISSLGITNGKMTRGIAKNAGVATKNAMSSYANTMDSYAKNTGGVEFIENKK